jgi:hypothetical protein
MAATYMVAQRTKEESNGKGEGIELLTQEDYTDGDEKGQYFHKIYHYRSRLPGWMRWAVPKSLTDFHEKSWSAYPHGRCVYSVPGMGKRFYLEIESRYIPYDRNEPIPENLLGLSEDDLKHRKIKYPDIITSKPNANRPDWDLHGFECESAGISKMAEVTRKNNEKKPPEWTETYPGPMMVAVKVLKCHIKIFGLQGRLEKFAANLIGQTLLESARAIVGWADRWSVMSLEEIVQFSNASFGEVRASIAATDGYVEQQGDAFAPPENVTLTELNNIDDSADSKSV